MAALKVKHNNISLKHNVFLQMLVCFDTQGHHKYNIS